MAKKDKLSTGRTSIDNDLDIPDFDFDSPMPKDNRKPITKVVSGMLSGAKSTLKDASFIRKALRASLPETYGTAFDLGDEVSRNAKQLYNNAAKEIKPSISEMMKAADKLAPASATRLKAAINKIDKWADESSKDYGTNPNSEREDSISSTITDTFRFQMQEQAKSESRIESREQLQAGLDLARHRDIFGLLNNISQSTSRLSQYNEKVTAAYQKKSLELQYRSYFVAMDSLEEAKKQNAIVKEQLASIKHNTGLPDYVKLTESERLGGLLRNKFAGKVGGMLGSRDSKLGGMIDHANKIIMEKVSSAANAFSMAAFSMDAAADMKSSGMDPANMAGNAIGSGLINSGANSAGKYIRGKLAKYDKLNKLGHKTSGFIKNLPQHLNEFARTDMFENEGSIPGRLGKGSLGKFLNMVAAAVKPLIGGMGMDGSLEKDSASSLTKPAIYTKQTHKTINEVIPGYLARIFRELQVLRTGDTGTQLTVYDVNKNKFTDKASAAKSAFKSIVNTGAVDFTKNQIQELLNIYDPANKLSPAARVALGKKLLRDNANNRIASPSRLSDKYTYSNDKETSAHAHELSTHMGKFYGMSNGKAPSDLASVIKHNSLAKKNTELGDRIEDGRAVIQNLINLGDYETLEAMGIVNEDHSQINFDALMNYHAGKEFHPTGDSLGKGKKYKVQRSVKRRSASPNTSSPSYTPASSGGYSKTDTPAAILHLQNIENLIAEGNLAQQGYFLNLVASLSAVGTGGGGGGTAAPANNENIFQGASINIRNLVGKTTKMLGKGITLGNKIGGSALRGAGAVLSGGMSAARFGIDAIAGGLEKLGTISDLWFPGETSPRLQSVLLKAGHYYDQATGKVLTSLEGIKGAVTNKDGTNVYIKAQELKDSFIKNAKGSGIIRIGKMLMRGITSVNDTAMNVLSSTFGMATGIARSLYRTGRNLLDQPTDIYVAGLVEPVMTATVMRGAGYFIKGTMVVVDRPSKIGGAIVNRDGEVVLTEEQIKHGIFDVHGKRIRTPLQKLSGLITSGIGKALTLAKKIVKSGIKFAGGILKGGLKGFKNIGGKLFGKGGSSVAGADSLDMLTNIFMVLNDRLPNNNGGGPGRVGNGPISSRMKLLGGAGGLLGAAAGAPAAAEGGSALETAANTAVVAKTGYDLAKGGIKSAGKGLLKGGKWLGRGALAALPFLGELALGAGGALMTGAAAAGSAALTGLGAIAGYAATALAAIGSVLTAPVVLGTLALAAVGIGGYYAYKYFTAKDSKLKAFRVAQYGFSSTNADGGAKTIKLEETLSDNVFYEKGVAKLSDKKIDIKQALAVFNVDTNDEKKYNEWISWFTGRFKPVYLTHLTALYSIDDKITLTGIDKLSVQDKSKYLELVRFKEGPYNVTDNPDPTSKIDLIDSKGVEVAYQEARAEVDGELKDNKDGGIQKAAAAATAAVVTYDAMGNPTSTAANNGSTEEGAKDASKTTGPIDYTKINGALATGATISVTGSLSPYRSASTADALEGVRLRTYGLITLENDKVTAIRKLEDIILKYVTFDGDGKAVYKASTMDAVTAGGMLFGVAPDSDASGLWSKWYQTRFLPVFLTYLGMIKQMTGSAPKPGLMPSLKASQALSIATQISSVSGVWSITASPWFGYKLGTDEAIVKPFIQSLRDAAKQEVINEATVPKTTAPQLSSQETPDKSIKDAIAAKSSTPNDPVYTQDSENSSLNKESSGAVNSSSSVGNLTMAGGDLSDGRNASQYFKLAPGATLDGVNGMLKQNFYGMVEEYGRLTGKTTYVTSGFRTRAEQAALRASKGAGAAAPGTSPHEYGLALDVSSSTLDDMDKRGLLRKYGFIRPVGGERWHMEPIGIQSDMQGFKNDPAAASRAIQASLGRGGGGLGADPNSKMGSRDGALSQKIFDSTVSASGDTAKGPEVPAPSKVGAALTSGGTAVASGKPASFSTPTYDAMGNVTGSVDSEPPAGSIAATAASPGNVEAIKSVTPGTGGKYSLLPDATGGKGWNSNQGLIIGASKMVGVDPKLMASMASIESNFDPMAKAPNTSASGLYQFTEGTWKEMLGKHASKYGIDPNASPFDAKANALMGAEYLKQNINTLSGIKKDVTGTDAYMAHFLGAGGAKSLLTADPNAIAANILPAAASSNRNIFYAGNNARTVSGVYSVLNTKVQNSLKQNGITGEYATSVSALPMRTASTTVAPSSDDATYDAMGNVTGSGSSSTVPSYSTPSSTPSFIPSTSADTGGFNLNNIPTQTQNPRSDMNSAIGDMSSVLKESLDVQKQMLLALQAIAVAAASGASQGAASAAPIKQVSDAAGATYDGRNNARSQGEVPVRMSRNSV